MKATLAASAVLMLSVMTGCAGKDSSEAATAPKTETAPETETTLMVQPVAEKAVVVRFCPGVDETKIIEVLQRHTVSLTKRSSPSLATLSWHDDRTIEAIISALEQEQEVICAVQPDFQYKASPQ